jgi:Ni/Co efflux regulator RcnB
VGKLIKKRGDMKTFIAMLVIVCFTAAPMTSFAAKGGQKGPDDNAYKHANDNAKFKRDAQAGEAGDEAGEIIEAIEDAGEKDKYKDMDKDRGKDEENGKKKQKQKKRKKQKGKD